MGWYESGVKQRKKQPAQTRQAILEAAGQEFSLNGYSGTGLGSIVTRAGLTKGALFHHFADKRSLAMAWAVDVLAPALSIQWITPLESLNSLDELRSFGRTRCMEIRAGDAISTLVSLTAETATAYPVLGESFGGIFSTWRSALATLLERGKSDGWIHRSIQPAVEASFLVSVLSGFSVTTKCATDDQVLRACAAALEVYLETLRAL